MANSANTILVCVIPNEPMRFWASSQSNPGQTHIVDLSKYSGNGECQCPDFMARRLPAIRDGKELFTDFTSCKHVRAVRAYWCESTLRNIAKMITEQETNGEID